MNGEVASPVHRVFHDLSTFSVDKKKELLFYGSLKEFPHVQTGCALSVHPGAGVEPERLSTRLSMKKVEMKGERGK
ncbi:MAG: hypothetical protein GXP52_03790 [Deltaproteobacteria bacterium]|nr:hypothetical protein [Deltaproteobacteria bacterium]